MNIDEINIVPIKLKIQYIEYDANTPCQAGDFTDLICKPTGWFTKKKYKLPYHWVGKTKPEAIENFFGYRDQMKKSLKFKEMKD